MKMPGFLLLATLVAFVASGEVVSDSGKHRGTAGSALRHAYTMSSGGGAANVTRFPVPG